MTLAFRFAIVLLALLFVRNVSAQARAVNPQALWTVGPKFGYTFGPSGGSTFGAEVSYFPTWNPLALSFTFDATFWSHRQSFHFGAQFFAAMAGLDAGPTIFIDSGRVATGFSLIPWLGVGFYWYYEFDVPFRYPIYQSTGGYLKLPVGPMQFGYAG